MGNKDFYRKTFSQIHSSKAIAWEDMEQMKPRKRPSRRLLPLIAVLCVLAVLTGTAVAVNFLGLRDLLLPKAGDVPDSISLSGFMDSPESMALTEWQDFLDTYDQDGRILHSVGNTLDPELEEYINYFVYSREMADKLEEIAAKYDLKLHTDCIDLSLHPEGLDSCGDYLASNIRSYPMYMYEDGTFAFDGEAFLPDHGITDIQFRRSVKGTFNEVILTISDAAEYEQWSYDTTCGIQVLLALGPGKALVLADLPDSFVTINVLAGTELDGSGLTKADLEALADSVDFTKLTPAVAPEFSPEPTPAPVDGTAREYFTHALKDLCHNGIFPDGTEAEGFCGEDNMNMDLNQFVVYDVDGDGSEELIINYIGTYTAGMKGCVVDFDPGYTGPGAPLRVQHAGFPSFTFYENGSLTEGWSHNQGLAGDALWPYDLFLYNSQEDAYEPSASVDAWDKSLRDTDYNGVPFPDEADEDGDGILYYVRPAGIYGEIQPMDGQAYRDWLSNAVGEGQELDLPYQALTLDNINALTQ